MSTPLSRRTFAKGVAWAPPTLITTTVIPAYAASRRVYLDSGGGVYKNLGWDGKTAETLNDYKVFVNNIVISGTQPGDTISNLKYTFWFAGPDAQFFGRDGTKSYEGWTLLSRDNSQDNRVYSGKTYYPYTVKFTDEIISVADLTFVPNDFEFISSPGSAPNPNSPGLFMVVASVMVNNEPVYLKNLPDGFWIPLEVGATP